MSKITITGIEYHTVLQELINAVEKEGIEKVAIGCHISCSLLKEILEDRKNAIPQPVLYYLGYKAKTVYIRTGEK
jgi:hypothetical protein